MKKARSFLILHENCDVTTTVYVPHNNPISLSIAHYEFLKLKLKNTMPCYNIIEVFSKFNLVVFVQRLNKVKCCSDPKDCNFKIK